MSASVDVGLRSLSDQASARHDESAEQWVAQLSGRLRRRRRARGAALAGVTAAVVAGLVLTGSALGRVPKPLPPVAPAPPAPSSAPSTARPSNGVIEGWHDAGAVPAVFHSMIITDAVEADGRIVAVGCSPHGWSEGTETPIWVGDDATSWHHADLGVQSIGSGSQWTIAGASSTCLTKVEQTRFGLFAAGSSMLVDVDGGPWLGYATGATLARSQDVESWSRVMLAEGEPGVGVGVEGFVVTSDAVVVLTSEMVDVSHGVSGVVAPWAPGVATLWTSADGVSWQRVAGDRAAVFDGAAVFAMEDVGGTFVAVGALPEVAGETMSGYSSAAAAWTSSDGLTWRPAAVEGGAGCYLVDVAVTPSGLLGAGTCKSDGPALWTSTDGASWQRTTAPSVDLRTNGFVRLYAIQVLDDTILLAGMEAGGSMWVPEPREWRGSPEGGWERTDGGSDRYGGVATPFAVVDGIGFWPRVGDLAHGVVLAQD